MSVVVWDQPEEKLRSAIIEALNGEDVVLRIPEGEVRLKRERSAQEEIDADPELMAGILEGARQADQGYKVQVTPEMIGRLADESPEEARCILADWEAQAKKGRNDF
ncbi:hypothetical protein BH11ARM2_BH11ARM2_23100 [soil metagenome]